MADPAGTTRPSPTRPNPYAPSVPAAPRNVPTRTHFSPPAPPPTILDAPAPPLPPSSNSRTAIASMICGVASLVLTSGLAGLSQGNGRLGGTFGLVGVGAAIAAIILAIIAFKEIRQSNGRIAGRGFAVAGLVLGIVVLAIVLLVILLAVLFAFLVAAICASLCGTKSNVVAAGLVGFAIAPRRRNPGHWLAHHPECSCFDADVRLVFGRRVCAGCLVAHPVFLGAFVILTLLGALVPWQLAFSAAVLAPLGLSLSLAGLTRSFAAKTVAKVLLGVGGAFALHGWLLAPLAWPLKAVLVTGVFGIGVLLATQRPKAWSRTCAHWAR